MNDIINVQNAVQVERTAEEKKEIAELKVKLYEELSNEKKYGDFLESTQIKIGIFLDTVKNKKVWQDWGYKSWDSFLQSIAPMVHKGRTSLYNYADVAKQLLPYIPPEELPEVGITKARALSSAVKKAGGKRPSDTLLNAAKSPAISLEDMHALIEDNFGARDETEKGIWYSLGGVFFSPEEKTEFENTIRVACHTDPALPYNVDWPDASAPQKKELLWRLCAEYLSAHGTEDNDEVFGG